MKKIITYILVFMISLFAFTLNTNADEIENLINNENNIVDVVTETNGEEELSEVVIDTIDEDNLIEVITEEFNESENNVVEVIDTVDNMEEVSYQLGTNNYQVTFTHDGYSFNIKGGSTILLSQLNQKLNINIVTSDVYEIYTSDETILSITKVEGSNDYAIKSLRSFDTEETLVIHTTNGDEYIIKVTDPEGEPEHNKDLIDNEDGTYTLSLEVTGDSIPESNNKTNVNVIIVYDTSQSMSTTAGTSSYRRGDQAEAVVHGFISSLAEYQDKTDPSNIEMALVTFDATGNTRRGLTTNLDSILSFFDSNGTNGRTNFNYGTLGTNWQAALELTEGIITNSDHDKTYVIFVTDGAPTAANGISTIVAPSSSLSTLLRYYNEALPFARSVQGGENTELYGIYIYGDEADLLDDLMYNSFQAAGEERTVGENTVSAPNYYNASETSFLQTAIDDIKGQVIQAMGVSSVQVVDGTTSSIKGTFHLLDIDETSYEYWLSMDVTPVEGQNDTYSNSTTGSTITFTNNGTNYTGTWTDSKGSHSITGDIVSFTDENNITKTIFKIQWTAEGNGLHSEAPTAAELITDENGNDSVVWDLSSHGVLLNGVTYTVTFKVWPSQYTLDTIADLKNHPENYDTLDPEVQQYIERNGEGDDVSYTLKTNTEAYITFVDTRPGGTNNGISNFDNPDPVNTIYTQSLAITKDWVNNIDTRPKRPIQINVLQDGEIFNTIELNEDNNYSSSSYISVGIMLIHEDGSIELLTSGHDYSFGELGSDAYNWELKSDIVRPMLINGELTLLINNGDVEPEEGTYYLIDGVYYVVGELNEGVAELTAVNERRSYIDIEKDVTYDDPSFPTFDDELFEFTINVVDKNGEDIWFSVKESKTSDTFITEEDGLVVIGATKEEGTDYYYAPSGEDFIVRIKKGWNLRIINLLSGTTYTITESNINEKFIFSETKLTINDPDEEEPIEIIGDSETLTGTIEKPNMVYSVIYTNRNVGIDITVTKVWDDGDDELGVRPDSVIVNLSNGDEAELNADNNWTFVFENLPIYDEAGEVIEYDVEEEDVPGYISNKSGDIDEGFTFTNTVLTSITITKVWEDNDDELNRPESITIQLQANSEDYGDEIVMEPDEDGEWILIIEDLPAYIDGEKITYTVKETVEVPGYDTSYSEDGLTIINTLQTISIEVTKNWEDEGNEENRPSSISIILLANGDLYDTYEITADDDWTITIEDLPLYINGEEITYDVDELSVDNYITSKTGDAENGFVITNSYEAVGTIEPPHTGIEANTSVAYNANTLMLYISLIGLIYLKRKVYINM
ncbi:MAG: Cna B-type domain-containing protein [Bacilli bacterium]|nr:Cna B-type domain-containing protein [Bacilli bacterium]